MKVKWIATGSSDEDDEEFFVVDENFDSKILLINPEGDHDLLAQAKNAEWAERIVVALNSINTAP